MLTYFKFVLPWELATLLLVVGGIYLAYWGYRNKKMFYVACGAIIALTVLYGSFVESRRITVTEAEVTMPMEEEMTIVVLSDFEVGPYKGRKFIQRIVDRVNEINPDLILLAGDYIYIHHDTEDAFVPLADLSPKYGIYGVLGNHEYSCYRGNISHRKYVGFDYSLKVRRALERVGVRVLRNESERVSGAGFPTRAKSSENNTNFELYISGVDDACTGRADVQKALPKPQHKAPIIMLAHDPSVILENHARYPHLIVSGHTHGGQIRLPFIGPIGRLPTQLGRKYDQGLFAVDKDTTLAITRGVGESGARARLFAPPEIMVLKLVPSPSPPTSTPSPHIQHDSRSKVRRIGVHRSEDAIVQEASLQA